MSPPWNPTTKRIVLIGVVIFLVYLIAQFGKIIPPLLVAVILSYILHPFAEFLEVRLRLPRTWAVGLVFLILIALLALAPAILVPVVIQQAEKIDLDLQQLTDNIAEFLAQPVVILNYSLDLLTLYNELIESAQDFISPFAAQTVGFIFDVAGVFVWIVVVFVVSFYLLKDTDAIVRAMDRLVPPDHLDEFRKLRHEINGIWHNFFRGQLIQCLVIGTIVGVVMALAGVRDALVLAAIAALFELIPKAGHSISGTIGMLFAFFQGPSYHQMPNLLFALLVGTLYALIFFIDTNYILPRILGRRVHLHPLVVIVGIIAGTALGGVLGMFMATPVLGTFRVLGRYVHHKLLDMPPYPEAQSPAEAATIGPEGLQGPHWLPAGEIEAVLFDLDGTLIDPDEQQTEALARRLRSISNLLPNRDPEQAARRLVRKTGGPVNTVLAALDVVGLDDAVLDLGNRLRRLKGERTAANFRMVPGAAEAVRALDGHYRLGIVTARGQRDAEDFLAQYQLTDLFEVVVTRESTPRLKPHPQPVCHAAETLGLPPERCVVVGDTAVDIAAAQRAGARSIGVLCGFGEREELTTAGADLILESTARLSDWLI
jgi:predicted PurR-regulated permease PerM/phosphoglycolate phosphatase-like HAD superfamily hydrolase